MSKKQHGFFLKIAEAKLNFFEFISPFGLMMMRLWVALAFWNSGLIKFKSWDSTLFLFEEEYKTYEQLTFFGTKFLTAESSAILATLAELVLPLMLILGIGARQAAFGLLILVFVLEKTYSHIPPEDSGIWAYFYLVENIHIAWGVVLGAIILMGAGRFSWDYFVRANYFGFEKSDGDMDKLLAAFVTVCLSIYTVYLILSGFFLS